jgi:hypothetical protein
MTPAPSLHRAVNVHIDLTCILFEMVTLSIFSHSVPIFLFSFASNFFFKSVPIELFVILFLIFIFGFARLFSFGSILFYISLGFFSYSDPQLFLFGINLIFFIRFHNFFYSVFI